MRIKMKEITDETKWHRVFIFWPRRCFDSKFGNCWVMLTHVWRRWEYTKPCGHYDGVYDWRWRYRTKPPSLTKNELSNWSN